MARYRFAIVAAVLIVFIAVGAYLAFGNKKPHTPQNVTFNVTVTKATSMHPSELPVNQNDTVTINITSDTDGEVHLHGYDIPSTPRSARWCPIHSRLSTRANLISSGSQPAPHWAT